MSIRVFFVLSATLAGSMALFLAYFLAAAGR
jgi:hypothetical protein